jgi:hypothetical protein
MRRTWFLILRGASGEYPSLVYDDLPSLLRPEAILHGWRLDRLPDAARLCAMSLDELYHGFCWRRDRGTLPPENRADPPRQKGDRATALHGHREKMRAPNPAPYEPTHPGPPRPDAGAFIRDSTYPLKTRRPG